MDSSGLKKLTIVVFSAALLSLGFAPSTRATSYWVSPTGSNTNNGLSQGTAWRTLDNGELTAVIGPGDTVNILPGTYAPTATYFLNTSGTAAQPIVYQKYGKSPAIINAVNASNAAIIVNGAHTKISGLRFIDASDDAIILYGDSCTISYCVMKNPHRHGIRLFSSYNTIYRNVIYLAQNDGIKNEDAGEFGNVFYHNTIYGGDDDGIALGSKLKTGRLFNNQIITNNKGITGKAENILGFNNVWGNPKGNLDGVVDSAGGISKNPKFVDAVGGRFDLEAGSPAINVGLDIGFRFSGSAPDMGAFEIYNAYYVDPTGNDADNGLSPATAWATIDNGDSSLFPGDTVNILPGDYTGPVIITDSGLQAQHIVYQGQIDSCRIDGSGLATAVRISGTFVVLSGVQVSGANSANIESSGDHNDIDYCRIDSSNQYGLNLNGGTENSIRRSVFYGNTAGSIKITGDKNSVLNCTFYDSAPYGVDALTASNCDFTNNVFLSETGTNTALRATLTSAFTYSAVHGYAATVAGGVALGTGSFTTDPLLVDPAGGDFHLGSLSPAIDAGKNIGLDFQGSAPDMGAFESGTLASLEILPVIDTMRADSQYQFTAVGYDSAGYAADYGTLTWNHTFGSGTISSGGLFTPQNIGNGQVQVTSDIDSISVLSSPMTVVTGPLAIMSIAPDIDTVSADSTRLFTVTGTDSKGNTVADLGTVTWSVLGGIGTIDAAGLFTASTAGNGFVRASSSLGVSTTSDTITVLPGALAHLQVQPTEQIMSVTESFQFSLYGLDADSNSIKVLTDSAAWSTDDGLGSISGTGLYTAGATPAPYQIWASYEGFADTVDVIVTLPGGLSYIQVERFDGTLFGDTTISTDVDTTRLWCRGYTTLDALIGDVAVDWSVLGNDSIGMVGGTATTSTVLTLTTPGTGRVIADYSGTLADTSGVITCVAGAPAGIAVAPDTATITADSSLQFTAESVDADGNPSSPGVAINWAVLGGIGTISAGGLFSPSLADTGYVVAFGAGLADTVGPIVVTPGALTLMTISPDSVTLPFDMTRQFEVVGYDSHGNERSPGTITWQVLDAFGSIDGAGLFTPSALGVTRIRAASDLGPVDTTSLLEIVPGQLASIEITPDSVDITTDDYVSFVAIGYDIGSNPTSFGNLTWDVLNGVGEVNQSGYFSPLTVGTERVHVSSSVGGVADTNSAIVISAGILDRLVITPNDSTIEIGDSVQFIAEGYDQMFNPAAMGTLTWSVNGSIGSIDSTGLFVATGYGAGSVTVSSDIGVSKTSGAIVVEALLASTISIGTMSAYPGGPEISALALRIDNSFASTRYLTGVTLRSVSRGAGTPAEILSNLQALSLYLDMDNDSLLSIGDSLLATTASPASVETLSFDSLEFLPGTTRTLVAGVAIDLQARDGDSLDFLVVPAQDIHAADGAPVAGADTLNSSGYTITNGMVSAQVTMTATTDSALYPSDSVDHLATIDIPRNGYKADTLDILSIRSLGTATETDFDSLILYRDNGNGVWGGPTEETRLGKMAFTGTQWTRSGINSAIATTQGRFYLGCAIANYPTDGATIVLSIPGYGIEMRSTNDGPLDGALVSSDTATIRTNEQISIAVLPVTSHSIVPGANSGSLMAITLVNSYQATRFIDSLRLSVPMTDPRGASQSLLDSQIDSIRVYLETDNDLTQYATSDTIIGRATVSNGQVLLNLNGYPLPAAGGTITISASVKLHPTTPRNGNTIGLRLTDASGLFVSPSSSVAEPTGPANAGTFTVDAFPAAAVTIQEVGVSTIFGSELNKPVLKMKIPGNGYALDTLRSFAVVNSGTLDDLAALTRVALWLDKTGDGFSAGDSLLGDLRYNPLSGAYEVTTLRSAVPPTGINLAVTIDVALDRFDGGTLLFRVPIGGLKYRSGTVSANMSGPDDAPVGNPTSQLVVPSNRITAISIPEVSAPVRPGAESVPLLTFALYNGYLNQTKTLSAVTLSNLTRTLSDEVFADAEVGQVSLYYDADANRSFEKDSLIGSGYFGDGRLPLTGFAIDLPPESLSFFFVVADIPVNVIDSDSLAVSIAARSDFQFKSIVNLNGDLPLNSGAWKVIDGSVKRQYEILPLSPQTVSPGDTLVPLVAFRPAHNGDQVDQLTDLTITNTLTADGADVTNVRLWLDTNADDVWQVTDSSIGVMTYSGGVWSITGIAVDVPSAAAALFVTGDIALGATPNASFEATIPLNGCRFASGNDGPIDSVLNGDGSIIISSSGLRVTYTPLAQTFSVGQPIALRFSATNLLGSSISGVTGEVVSLSDSSAVVPDSAVAGPLSLAPGATGNFVFYYTAAQAGSLSWRIRAVSAAPLDTSATVKTASVTIQNIPSSVSAQLLNTAPTAVTRGQTNIFPMSLRLTHGDTVATTASVRIDSLRIGVEDGAGIPQSAADVFDRIVLATGYFNLTILETIPDQSSLWLIFDTPVILPAHQVQQFTLLVDISATAVANEFVLVIADGTAIEVVDRNSLQPVPVNPATTFPMKTASCRIDDPSQQIVVANISPTVSAINVGQQGVTLLTLGLRHPGNPGSSQVQMSSLSLNLTDINGDTLDPSILLDKISVINQLNQIGLVTGAQLGTGAIVIPLTTPVTLSAGETQAINVLVSPAVQTAFTTLSLVIPDSTRFVVRDLSSGSPLDVATDPNALASGSVFPLSSTVASLRQPAQPPELCLSSTLPVSLVGGLDSLSIASVRLTYPVDNGYSPVTLNNILVNINDTLQRPLDPDRLFDRIGYRSSGGGVVYQSFVDLVAGAARFSFGPSGIQLQPGDTVTFELVADIEADVPYDHFVAMIHRDLSLSLLDATDTTHSPGVATASGCSDALPFVAGPATIYLPAGRPQLTLPSLPVQLAYPGQQGVTFATVTAIYQSPTLQGDIALNRVIGGFLRRFEGGQTAASIEDVFSRLQLVIDGDTIAVDSAPSGDSIALTIDSSLVISRGESVTIAIVGDLSPTASIGNYLLVFEDSLFFEAVDKNLSAAVYPVLSGLSYPLFSTELSVSAPDLAGSFSNFPNPFVASRGEKTTIAYVLVADAYVDIEIFTVTGDLVTALRKNSLESEGPHQDLTWDGRTSAGLDLAPGTYFCRITARFVGGGSQSARRKIAVVR